MVVEDICGGKFCTDKNLNPVYLLDHKIHGNYLFHKTFLSYHNGHRCSISYSIGLSDSLYKSIIVTSWSSIIARRGYYSDFHVMASSLSSHVFVLFSFVGSGHTQTSSSLFQCHSSSNQNGLIYTPNILDFYFNDVNAANFRTGGGANLTTSRNGFTYIFTIPSESSLRNCSGTVVSLQYCYEARNSELRKTNDVFNFLSITRNNLLFTANSRLTIQTTPQNSICTDPPGGIQQICCDTSSLSANNQFQLPSSDFTFGVVITNSNVRPLVFTTSALEYRVEQFQAALGADGPTPGNRVTLGDNTRVNGGSLVFRFLIGKVFKN